jgi:hypothetical protein
MTINHDAITVASQSDMFQGMQTGERFAAGIELIRLSHQIKFMESDILDCFRNPTQIQNFNFPERSDVRDKPIHPGTNINMT